MKHFTIILLLISLIAFKNATAQEDESAKESPISLSCDLMSRYVWRGLDFGSAPSIQPGIEYSKNGFTAGAWGAYTFTPGGQETDFYIGYTYNDILSFTVTDYFFPDELSDYNYFDFDSNTTGHLIETTLSYNGTEKLPLSITLAANVWGADALKINDDGTEGDIQYSSYAEVAYSFSNLDVFMGANLTSVDTDRGEVGFYGDDFGIINLGISSEKEIKITDDFSLPLSIALITNPQAEKIYFVAGFSF